WLSPSFYLLSILSDTPPNIYKQIQPIYKELKTTDFDSQPKSHTLLNASAVMKKNLPNDVTFLSKPFLLLAGISGTGKTRFVREQAKATGSLSDTYCLTSVRPDWHEPSDILGYISRLGRDGHAEYITTDVLQFIARAWRAIIDAELELKVDGDCRLTVTGNQDQLNQVLPYWLCLDEMNLAPVEQYFADYLSVLETREWQWNKGNFNYHCDPLLKPATIKQLEDINELRNALGFVDVKYDREWKLFCAYGLSLPFNLIVAGTVNMDETTHGFSRKVIDRALSFDFGDFFPNDFDHFFESKVTHNTLSYPLYSHATADNLPVIDSDGHKSIEFLKAVNQVLDNTPFKLAFRALNELLLAVISAQPKDEQQLQAAWDDFLMCKVLPRIEGDYDKLALIDKATTSNEQSLLTKLATILERELSNIWTTTNDVNKLRTDLYRKNVDGSTLSINCRSKAKLAWMQQRLEHSGFTSFWP
ncbi:McrB family protein, partial [Psychrobacter sp.]|uniref:McrB family protein n=4 Tax=Psychrobacter TaxID=497 RepID=UPI003F95D2FB